MYKSSVKVVPTGSVLGGWKGDLTIDGDVLTVDGRDPSQHVSIDAKDVKSSSFNSNNGLWVFKLQDGTKVRMQSAGRLLSADRSPAGKAANDRIRALLADHGVRGFHL